MSRWSGLNMESEGTGITRALSEDVNLLGAMLGEAIFHLVNQAEKQEIIRVNRERSRAGAGAAARPESLGELVRELADSGALDLSPRTVKRQLRSARAWLEMELRYDA